jgi:hypothetical protein
MQLIMNMQQLFVTEHVTAVCDYEHVTAVCGFDAERGCRWLWM